MKTLLAAFLAVSVLTTGLLNPDHAEAQAKEDVIELLRADIRLKRRAILSTNMNFTEEQSKKFWPLYREYETATSEVSDKKIAQVKKFADNYETMDEKTASDLIKAYFKLTEARLEAKEDFVKSVSKKISPLTAARFLQIDNQLDRVVQIQAASKMPLIINPDSISVGGN